NNRLSWIPLKSRAAPGDAWMREAGGFSFNMEVVEDIYKRRQPLPTMDAVYFIQPTKEK
ncbi:hypothetical protein KSS87_015661, partial [Heliosperma pusillum]